MKSSTKNGAKPASEYAYYRQRYQNRVFAKLVEFITEEAQRNKITKKEMAERLGKDAGQLSRLLSNPSNLTLDTISDLLLALDAEAEPPQIVCFRDRRPANYMHPLMARVLNVRPQPAPQSVSLSTGSGKTYLNISDAPATTNASSFSFNIVPEAAE